MPLLGEWCLSFGIVATCLVIPGPMAGVEYWSFKFDLSWSAKASGAGNAARSCPDRGNSCPEQLFRTLCTHESCVQCRHGWHSGQ
jgi:hypothetical protein